MVVCPECTARAKKKILAKYEEDVEEEAVQPIVSEKVLPTGRILPESEVSKRAKANADILNPRMSLFSS